MSSLSMQAQVAGRVLDDHGHELPNATIEIGKLSAYTDNQGRFKVTGLGDGPHAVITSFLGYKSDTTNLDINGGKEVSIIVRLLPSEALLNTVVISEEHAKQEVTLHADHLHEDFFENNVQGTFAQSIEKIPGISAINVGVGIAKPVIRGLSSNRIIVNHNGIKQESQQWGSDHGLEIDQFDVERVEIIKGPGSLQYGSDGLGGVVNIMPAKLLPQNTYAGSVLGLVKSNNNHFGGSAKFGVNVDDIFLTARYSHQEFADYRVPADQFVYNGFDLPILNNALKNTAGRETNVNINAGLKRLWGITRLTYSHYSLDAGLFSGAVGVPRAYALTDDGNDRDIDVPSQSVDHYRLTLNQILSFGRNHMAIDIGYQRNHRREFSVPEFHSIPLSQLTDPNDQLAIELELETFSVGAHYEYNNFKRWKHIIGFNTQWQSNTRGGFEYLLPDFKTRRGGIYTISQKELSDTWLINGGLRFDIGTNQSDRYRQFIWNSNEVITDSLVSIATDDVFYNWSASLGTNVKFGEGRYTFTANLGKSFRVPYPSETVSNGIHHGTFRHEVGTPDLTSEQGYQLDLGLSLSESRFNASLNLYFNYFDNYIYLGPTFPARFSRLPEAGQIFQYRQDDAIYTGFELQWDYQAFPWLEVEQAIDFVQSYNPQTELALPFTPQPAIKTEVNYDLPSTAAFEDSYLSIGHQYYFAAEGTLRVDRSEQPTPAYQLWSLGAGSSLHLGNQKVNIKCEVQNISNTRYLAHLSRYRVIEVPEQGRNIVLSIKVPFSGNLYK